MSRVAVLGRRQGSFSRRRGIPAPPVSCALEVPLSELSDPRMPEDGDLPSRSEFSFGIWHGPSSVRSSPFSCALSAKSL